MVDVNRYTSAWQQYDIRATPTVVRYEGGRERLRVMGEQPEFVWRRLLLDQRALLSGRQAGTPSPAGN